METTTEANMFLHFNQATKHANHLVSNVPKARDQTAAKCRGKRNESEDAKRDKGKNRLKMKTTTTIKTTTTLEPNQENSILLQPDNGEDIQEHSINLANASIVDTTAAISTTPQAKVKKVRTKKRKTTKKGMDNKYKCEDKLITTSRQNTTMFSINFLSFKRRQ